MPRKICIGCNTKKAVSEFHKGKARCKSCRAGRDLLYTDKEKIFQNWLTRRR